MDFENYLTTREAAELSGLSVSYLNKLRCFGGGSPYLKVGRKCIYRRDQFEAWLAKHQYGSIRNIAQPALKGLCIAPPRLGKAMVLSENEQPACQPPTGESPPELLRRTGGAAVRLAQEHGS